MKYFLFLILLNFCRIGATAQISPLDSMKMGLIYAEHDSTRYQLFSRLGDYYTEIKTDSALYFFNLARSVALTNKKNLSAAYALDGIGYCLTKLNAYGQSLESFNEGFGYARDKKYANAAWAVKELPNANSQQSILAMLHLDMGHLLGNTGNDAQQRANYDEAMNLARASNDYEMISLVYGSLGQLKLKQEDLDSAKYYQDAAIKIASETSYNKYLSTFYNSMARIYLEKENYDSARIFLHIALASANHHLNNASILESYKILTGIFLDRRNRDSSLYYAQLHFENIHSLQNHQDLGIAYENLFRAYALNNQQDSAFKYQGLALTTKDSIYSDKIKTLSEFQNLSMSEKMRIQQLEQERILNQERTRTYAVLGGTALIIFLAIMFYRNSRQQRKAHFKVKKAYSELQETQNQLIQREKMASLGELTAGIAHEIKNPLNFVNNFSEVNTELADEIIDAIDSGKVEEAKALVRDVRSNQEKIREHGKRADSIVKSMLQHSRSSTGMKESVDIVALVDEYVRLAYHGMKAKDKAFSAECRTQLSTIVGRVNVIPQEIGRVILNLVNNALYAVDKSVKKAHSGYKPEVIVSMVRTGNKVEIRIKDNGDGIPEDVREKIFQPFFTTKPTGEGTGLGLSLSYDIITKGHGGELKLETVEGKGTTFIILLPFS